MQGINKSIAVVLLITMLLISGRAFGFDGEEVKIPDFSSYVEYPMQISKWGNQSSHYSFDMLGIDEIDYIGTFIYDKDAPRWYFKTEPELLKIDNDGPSFGKLKSGDKIVAIDGMLITTEKAGERFANLPAEEKVELEIRRSGRKHTVEITPRFIPHPDIPIELTVRSTEKSREENSVTIVPGKLIFPEFGPLLTKFEDRQAEFETLRDSLGLLVSGEYFDRSPQGWIGFGLSFSGSIRRNDNGKPADWEFFEVPTIMSIQKNSPAEKAGLRVDDILLEIDGAKLDSDEGGKRFSKMEPGQTVEWKVKRGKETLKIKTEAEKRPKWKFFEPDVEYLYQDAVKPVKYTGTLGDVEIEVRGDRSVRVDENDETGETVIRSGDAIVTLKTRGKE